jgi:hypothetical protein
MWNRMFLCGALLLVSTTALPRYSMGQTFSSPIRSRVEGCIRAGSDQYNFVKIEVNRHQELSVECYDDWAKYLYTEIARLGYQPKPFTMDDNSSGVAVTFGLSRCYFIQLNPDGSSGSRFLCRIVIGVGDDVVNAF